VAILCFEKPKKLRPHKEHAEMYSSDTNIAGTYAPNMSDEDMKLYKAKHIKGVDERIEIRKSQNGTQILAIIYKSTQNEGWDKFHENVQISANGKIHMTFEEYGVFDEAIKEAVSLLAEEAS